jgi:hypothetical protein
MPLAFVAGIHGFAMFAAYAAVLGATVLVSRRFTA